MVRGSRAQLILIGALVVALSVIGVTVVINTVLFVENTPTDRQTARIDRAATVDDDARRAVRSTALRVNHRSRNHSASQVSDAVGRNVSALNDLFQQQYLSSQSLSVAVTYEGAATEGFRVVQAADGPLTSDAGSPDWSPVPAGSGRVGWLVVNLNATATATGRFYANVSNSAGETLSVALNKTSDRTVNVTSSPPGGGSTRVTCDVRNGRLALDLQRGRSVAATGCRFDGAEQLGSPTSVTFENGAVAVGKYAVVANESVAGRDDCDATQPASEPCQAPVVWAANVSVSVTSAEFEYRNRNNVSVYTEGG